MGALDGIKITDDLVDKFNPTRKFIKRSTQTDSSDSSPKVTSLLTNVSYDRILSLLQETKKDSRKLAEKVAKEIAQKEAENKVSDEFKKFKENQDKNKNGIIESLAIFVALFTFVSISINIFSKVEYLSQAIYFMILLLLCLIVLLLVFYIILHDKYNQIQYWIAPALIVTSMLFALYLTSNNAKVNPIINPQPITTTVTASITPIK